MPMARAQQSGSVATSSEGVVGLASAAVAPKQRSLWSDAFRRLSKNRLSMAGLVIIILLIVVAVAAPLIAPYSPSDQSYSEVMQDPSRDHPMGTDLLGRDTFSRLVYGARISLVVGVFTQAIVLVIGASVGGVAALGGRTLDNLMMRLTDIVYAFPDLLLIILLSQVLRDAPFADIGGGIFVIFLAVAVANWVTLARLIRGQMLSLKQSEFVTAARAMGATEPRIVFLHLLPNTLSPVIVALTFGIPAAIFAEASLSFIGVGIKPPMPSWGVMINQGYNLILATVWPVVFPAIAIALTMLSFTFLGDGLRDALDPRTR
jgi:oligopeptide transport system permease protein